MFGGAYWKWGRGARGLRPVVRRYLRYAARYGFRPATGRGVAADRREIRSAGDKVDGSGVGEIVEGGAPDSVIAGVSAAGGDGGSVIDHW